MAFSRDLYQQVILDHNQNPRNFKALENATHECQGHNPLCGDNVHVYAIFDSENICTDVSFTGSGCAISRASTSLMTLAVKGKSFSQIEEMFEQYHAMVKGDFDPSTQSHKLGKLTIFEGVKEFPARVKCATLSWHALRGAYERKGQTTSDTRPPQGASEAAFPQNDNSKNAAETKDLADQILDLSGVRCPINFVKTKVQLSKMQKGEKLLLTLDDGDPIRNVSRSLEMEGEVIVSKMQLPTGQHQLLVIKQS